MATKADFQPLATEVLRALGGAENVNSVTHCATRLRFKIADADRVDEAAVKSTNGVLTLVKAGGQHQVVVGNDVPLAYQAITALPGMSAKGVKDGEAQLQAADNETVKSGNPLNAFIDMISSLFSPIVWCLAGLGLGKAFLTLATNFTSFSADSDTYIVFNAAFDAFFFFLPLFLAATSARYFRVNQYVAMATVAPLVYPAIVELGTRNDVRFFGIPLMTASYASSVIAPVIAVWLAGYLQRWLERVLPGAIRNFFTPLIVVAVMVPVVLLTVGPATAWLSQLIADGVNSVFVHIPWLGGAIMGGFWQVLVIFGLHWAFNPIFLNELAVDGHSFIMATIMAAVLAQAAAALGVFLRTKNDARKKVAGAGVFSGFMAGVTEPIIYGVNLPLKFPFYAGCVGGAVGGAIIAMGGNAFDVYAFPSLLALPAAMNVGSFAAQLVGSGVAIAIGFIGSWILTPMAERRTDAATTETGATSLKNSAEATTSEATTDGRAVDVRAAVPGTIIPLNKVADEVFASEAMGKGVGIKPTTGKISSPVAGTVIAAPKSGHAFGIKTADGIEVLVHVGIDTVKMRGDGFDVHVSRGDQVELGQVLVDVDLNAIESAGYDDTTIVVITNTAKLEDVTVVAEENEAVVDEVVITASK